MGFSFSKSGSSGGGGGGAIHRTVGRNRAESIAGFGHGDLPVPADPLTSPQDILNLPVISINSGLLNGFTYGNTTDAGTISTSMNIDSSYWVDFIAMIFSYDGNDNSINSINMTINGSTVQRPYAGMSGFGAARTFMTYLDVYGYGGQASVYINFTNSTEDERVYMGMLVPNTIITESGSIVHPEGLAGRQVVRDI